MRLRAYLVVLATLAFAISPVFVPDFGGYEPSQFPVPNEDPPAQPAGYAFAIWGVIYLWLVAMAVFGAVKRPDDPAWHATRLPTILSLAVGAIWLPVAVQSPVWATVLIWVMLLGALGGLLRAPQRDLWLLRAPLGLYAGWLTAASCVAIGITLPGFAIPPLDYVGWAFAALLLALGLATAILRASPTLTYGVAVIWALIGVFVQNGGTMIGVLALGGAAAIAAFTALRLWGLPQ
ncbi:MAG: hypothetical protein AAFY65_10210 [Pseudomonadota bacterium]